MTSTSFQPATTRLRPMALPLLMLILVIGACAPAPDTAATPPESSDTKTESTTEALPIEMPQVVLPDGFNVTLELAITPEELSQGLMFRPKLAQDRGMLLIFAEERLPSIWMMNTLVALDLVYLDSAGTVVDVVPDAQPCPGEPCPRFTPKQVAKAVLEIPAGAAALHNVAVGVKLDFERVPEFPLAD